MKSKLPYWITTALFAFALFGSGMATLTRQPPLVATFQHLGYPMYFMTILGLAKLIGVVVVLVPGARRLKEWAYAGFVINLASAAISHVMAGDGAGGAAAPLVLLGLALASWWTRPESRKLEGPAI
jgi:hypothetical protein